MSIIWLAIKAFLIIEKTGVESIIQLLSVKVSKKF